MFMLSHVIPLLKLCPSSCPFLKIVLQRLGFGFETTGSWGFLQRIKDQGFQTLGATWPHVSLWMSKSSKNGELGLQDLVDYFYGKRAPKDGPGSDLGRSSTDSIYFWPIF